MAPATIPTISSATIVNVKLNRTEHARCWIPGHRRKAGDINCMISNWLMNSKRDTSKSTDVEGFSLVLELDQMSLKVRRDTLSWIEIHSYHETVERHFYLRVKNGKGPWLIQKGAVCLSSLWTGEGTKSKTEECSAWIVGVLVRWRHRCHQMRQFSGKSIKWGTSFWP